MSLIKINCDNCGNEFERVKKEYNRSKKLGRKQYCSRSCSGEGNKHCLGEHLGKARIENLVSGNRRDEYTKFKWFMKVIKQRSIRNGRNRKEYNIDLPYLKKLWKEQDGVCPLTGWELVLPKHSCVWDNTKNKIYRASLDRIDSDKGYNKGNVRFISVMANYCKNDFTDKEVILFCESVIKNNLHHFTQQKEKI